MLSLVQEFTVAKIYFMVINLPVKILTLLVNYIFVIVSTFIFFSLCQYFF